MVKKAKTGQSSHPAAHVGDPTEAQTRSGVPPVTEPDSWTPVVSRRTAKNNKRLARQRSWYQRQESTWRRRNTPSDGQTPSEPHLAGRLSTGRCPVGQMQRHDSNGQGMSAECPAGHRLSELPVSGPIGQRRSVQCPDGRGQCPGGHRRALSGCPIGPKLSAECPIGHQRSELPSSFPMGQRRLEQCPDGHGQMPFGRPIGQTLFAEYQIGHQLYELPSSFPMGWRRVEWCPDGHGQCPDGHGQMPFGRPIGQTLFAEYQIGHQLSELSASCPIGPRRFEWCPDGRGQCPDGHGQCPDGRGLPALRPIGRRRYDRCPDGHGQCPDGHGQRPSECPIRHPWSVQRLPPWAINPARATPAGGSSASSGVSDDGSGDGPDIRVAKVRMMQGGGRGQGPSSSSDWSSTDSPTNSPRRDRPAQAPGRRATAPTDYDASQGHPERADHSTGDVSEGARAREPTITMYRPSGGGSRTLPAGWREILPPNEAWGHSMDRGSEPESTRTAPQQGAGHSQARAHHSALPDNAGTQTDPRQSYGTRPGLTIWSDSTWPSVIIDMESPCGPPTHPMAPVSHSGTRSGVIDDIGTRGPSGSTRCSSDMSVYQDCTGVVGGLEWDDVSLRTAGRPWVESDRAGARVQPPNRRQDSYQELGPPPGFRDTHYLERPIDLRYPGHDYADYPSVRDDQTRVKTRCSGPPAVSRNQAHESAPPQPESRYIEDRLCAEHATANDNHRDEALAQDSRNRLKRPPQAAGPLDNPANQTRAAAETQPHHEVDCRRGYDQDARPQAHSDTDGARIQESLLEREVAAGHIVDRRRTRRLPQPPAERTRPGVSRRPPAIRTDQGAGGRAHPCPEVPDHLPEPDFRPRSVVFSDVVGSWPADATEPRLSPWLDPPAQPQPTNESVHPTERARGQTPAARRALVPHGPLQSSTQVRAPRNADLMSPRSARVSGFMESCLEEPWPTASAMQPVGRELRYQAPARLESADRLAQAHMAEVRLPKQQREARHGCAGPSYMGYPSGAQRNDVPYNHPVATQLNLGCQHPVSQHNRATLASYPTEMVWDPPVAIQRPTWGHLPPLPARMKEEPRVSVRPTETVPRLPQYNTPPQPDRYPARSPLRYNLRYEARNLLRDEVRPLAEPQDTPYQPTNDEQRTTNRYRSSTLGARYWKADTGAVDPRGHTKREGSERHDQRDERSGHPRRQHEANRRGPGDSPSNPDSSSFDDEGRPSNRQRGAPRREGSHIKGRKSPPDSSPDPSDGSSSEGSDHSDSNDSRRKPSHRSKSHRHPHKRTYLKLKDFDGRTCVEAFLARFEVVSRHNGWSEEDRLENLQCALEGNAAQVLWDQGSQSIKSCRRLIKHLRQRFGSEGQQCVYRTQLRSRVRPKGEPLSVTVDEVRRLMALAYPGPMSGDKQIIAIDALLNMLGDGELVLKIREREPETLEDAFKIALKLEAFQWAGAGSRETGHKPAYARQVQKEVAAQEPTAELKVLMKEYNQLQSEKLDRLFDKLRQSQNQTPVSVSPSAEQDGNPRQRSFGRGGNGRRRAPPREPRPGDKCFNCGEGGHYANRCPQPRIDPEPGDETTLYPIPNFASPPVPASQSQRKSGISGGAPSTPTA